MIDFYAVFFEFKRLLAIASTPRRQDHDTTPPIISTSSPLPTSNLRDPNTYRNGITFPPQGYTPAYTPSLYPGLHITPPYASGHSSSVADNHPSPPSPARSYAPPSWGPPPPLPPRSYSPSWSDISIIHIQPPPVYIRSDVDQPPPYLYSESSAGRAWHTDRVRNQILSDRPPPRRSRMTPVVGVIWSRQVPSDPSQNQHSGSYLPGPPRHGRDMHRGTLFARVIPARRNLWLPAIVVGAVVGVYVLVKAGGRDKDTTK
ncbi:hypothetical protein D9619_008990 [Psilocybe cf. subviscida]|uniref:Uncharacterized protein n=1 Tax=Psilocybe cf. subviscida TaxID=2480587 RepID=A0A8H5BUF7_9AGAR|nr:hypothetical protein D9619_008990 [Psilocybe cf. subviscida]